MPGTYSAVWQIDRVHLCMYVRTMPVLLVEPAVKLGPLLVYNYAQILGSTRRLASVMYIVAIVVLQTLHHSCYPVYICVCVLHIKLFFLLVDIQHTQRPR